MAMTTALLVVALSAFALAAGTTREPLRRTTFGEYEARGLVCNDGTPAGFFFRPAVEGSPMAAEWLVHLQGGHWCWDDATCMERNASSPSMMSSKWWPDSMSGLSGIFSDDPVANPSFWAANQVYVTYCTSDAHTGDRDPLSSASPWFFRGKRVVASVFEELNQKMGLHTATRVTFSGCSAGARGVIANVDAVAQLVAKYAPQAEFRAFADAGWWNDIEPFDKDVVSLQEQTKLAVAYFNGKADDDCMQVMTEQDYWKCFFAMYVKPFIDSAVFWQAEQYDAWQLSWDGVSPPFTRAESSYASSFASDIRGFMQGVADEGKHDGVFSPSCWDHCMSESQQFYRVQVESHTLRDTLQSWLEGAHTAPVIENCTAFNCSTNCIASW
eukprot:TRINITY_DN2186_c0_g1_i1.p1 TRINITY_DN2186_c0_g1~~TRINITY_DN2186_c0_g1_i1.p1  ORF type:complete len:384 (+),score=91.38 TRINITY_DN2186_c0_g1_i1:45-1196(+)